MNKIIYIGMDVHSTNFTLCSFEPGYGFEADKIFGQTQIKEDIFNSTVKYINKLKSMRADVDVICGYEAGCLGYNLHRKLKAKEIESVILAPTTMAVSRNSSKKKNDYRDAITIAKCLASSAYKAVYIPDEKDEDVRDFIRMRDDHKTALKQIKQQLNAFCLRHGHHYDKTKWTGLHLNWLRKLELSKVQRETVEEYLATYEALTGKIAALDVRIEDIASEERYAEKVNKLKCIKGIKTHTALSFVSEIGDFNRFKSADKFAGFIGLVPGECSSGNTERMLGITKAENSHLRRLVVEISNTYRRGAVGRKSASLKERQKDMPKDVVAYADKATNRCQRKYQRMMFKGKNSNQAVAAVARELCCFIFGMMTGHHSRTAQAEASVYRSELD